MEATFKRQVKRSFIWSSIDVFTGQTLKFVVGVILARLLEPSDYGTVGMLAIFFALSNSFINSGFSYALIQKKDCTEADYSTAFFVNAGLGLFFYVLLHLAAPYIASFYHLPILIPITRVVALTLVFNSLVIVQSVRLTKSLNFKLQTKIKMGCSIVIGILTIFLAYRGWGVWALVFQSVASSVSICVLYWICSRWKPSLIFSKASFRRLFSFGSNILITGLYGPIFDSFDMLVIGKFYSPALLGAYTKASTFAQFPSLQINSVVGSVTFPVLSKLQDQPVELCRSYRKIIKDTYFIVFPLMLGLLAMSDPLVLYVLGEKWVDCIPMLKVLCVAMSFYPICSFNINVLLVTGHANLHLRLDLIKKAVMVGVFCITVPLGVVCMCWGSVTISVFSWLLTAYYSGKLIHLSLGLQAIDLLPSLLIALVMCAAVYLISFAGMSLPVTLLCQLIVGIVVYLSLSLLLNRNCLREALTLFRR